jgi:hypothetical protein
VGDFSRSLANRFVPTLHYSGLADGVPHTWESQPTPEVPVVEMTGYAILPGGRVRVMLSNGRTYRAGDPRLGAFTPEYCVVDGVTNWLSVGPQGGVGVGGYGGPSRVASVSGPYPSFPRRNQPVPRGVYRP